MNLYSFYKRCIFHQVHTSDVNKNLTIKVKAIGPTNSQRMCLWTQHGLEVLDLNATSAYNVYSLAVINNVIQMQKAKY